MTGPKLRPNRRTTIEARARALANGPKARVHVGIPKAADTGAAEGEDGTPSASGSTAEIWLYGVVGGFWWGFDAEAVAAALRELPDDIGEVRVRVHSPGGSALEGIAIMNLLANFPAKVTVVVDGLAASAASVLILGGDDIVVSPGSQIMIHDASTYTYGNEAQLRSDADWIGKQSRNYAEVYATRGGTADERREAMTADHGRGTWYTASEAVADDVNLADRVGKIESVTPPPPAPSIDDWDDADEAAAAAAFDRDVLVANAAVWEAWATTPGALPRPPKPPTASAEGSTTPKGTSVVSLSDAAVKTLKAKLGVTAEDADEATILAALDEVLDEQQTEPTPTASSTTPVVPEGFSLVDNTMLAELREGAKSGREARTQQLDDHRARVIDAAIKDGKFAASRREHFEAAWKADPEGTEATIKALAPGLVPVNELGHDTPTGAGEAQLDDTEAAAVAGAFGLTVEDLR